MDDYMDDLNGFSGPDEGDDWELLPPYLRGIEHAPGTQTFGTLSYNRRSRCWVVRGDPSVTEMCKRLFPGSAGARRGEARFTAHRRAVGDLMWLMMRFPLEVKLSDLPLWDKAVDEARRYGCGAVQITASEMGVPLYADFGFVKNGRFMQYQLREDA